MNDKTSCETQQGEDARIDFLPRDRWMDDEDAFIIVGSIMKFDDRRIPIRVHPDVFDECGDEELEPMVRAGLSTFHEFNPTGCRDTWMRRMPREGAESILVAVNAGGVKVTVEFDD